MDTRPHLRIYLEPPLLESAVQGQHNFLNKIVKVAEQSRFRVEFLPSATIDMRLAEGSEGLSLTHMQEPQNTAGLVFRRVYHYPFWQIEQTAKRWLWDVAQAPFRPEPVPGGQARKFYRFWQNRLFGDAAQQTDKAGYVYVPLQGKLTQRRSFQKCTPLEMIEHCLHHDPGRQIVVTLHPKEQYSGEETGRLHMLAAQQPRLRVDKGRMVQHLQGCDYVVTQNSSAAFSGYFFGKSALLFAEIDFHHIAERADMAQLNRSFANVARLSPDFARYLWWFWQDQSINAGRDEAEAKIAARFQRFGWPMQ